MIIKENYMETKKELLARLAREVMHKDDNKIKGLKDMRRRKKS